MNIEQNQIPYQASEIFPANSVLVLAPHADDEIFGCGGALALHAQKNVRIQVVIATDGVARNDEIGTRLAESTNAARQLGIEPPVCWALPDRGLHFGEDLVARIVVALRATTADLVYAPAPSEVHPDHLALAMAAIEAVRRHGAGLRLAFYEIGIPLRPTHLIDITSVWESKQAAMRCFASQLVHQRYDKQIAALNQFRTYTLPHPVLAAEAYVLTDAEQLLRGEWPFPQEMGSNRARLQLSISNGRPFPLVTIMIRSIGRNTLVNAIASIATQTYPAIEILVINAKGADHPSLPINSGPFSPRRIDAPDGGSLTRTQAANAGLAAARGEYLLFLDDDDWIAPEHIGRLVEALILSPSHVAAYSDTECVDSDGSTVTGVFAQPFDASRLIVRNYLPIHSVLFSKRCLATGCRFDETLELFEDWDFWLQLVMLGDFIRVPGVSAYYYIHQSSGIHSEASYRSQSYLAIWKKWLPKCSELRSQQLLEAHWEQLESLTALKQQLIEMQAIRVRHDELETRYRKTCAELESIQCSTSWQITAPLRGLVNSVLRLTGKTS